MRNWLTDPPEADVVEVSIFGPGVGESVVVHLGGGKWIIVDSCKDYDGTILPLTYLTGVGVNLATDVLLVVGTHAHDDHIAGIADVFSVCSAASFVCSQALTKEEFVALTAQDEAFSHLLRKSSYMEYVRVFDIANEPRRRSQGMKPLRRALSDRYLLDYELEAERRVCVRALSPSDEAVTRSLKAFAKERARPGGVRRPTRLDPNELAIALWIQIAEKRLLLGADLLRGPQGCGWSAVLATFVPDVKASLFKVPHHGAPNADHDGVWTDLLENQPLALVAPYRAGRNRRPSVEDRARLLKKTPNAYITAPSAAPIPTRSTIASLGSIARNIRIESSIAGQVRARSRIGDPRWYVDVVSPASRLS